MAIFLLTSLFVLLIIGVPVAFALGLVGLASVYFYGVTSMVQMAQSQFANLDSFVLLAIPFFVLAGNVMVEGRMAAQLFDFVRAATRAVTGGAAIAGCLASALFGAMTGSSAASAAALGRVIIPELDRLGYPRDFSAGLFAAGGTLGIMIPPSIVFVIYAALAKVSVTDMFIAGIVPGFFLTLLMVVLTAALAKRNRWGDRGTFSWLEVGSSLLGAGPALLMPVLVLGGIYGGIFTPTEAAAIAAVYGIIVGGAYYRSVGLGSIHRIFSESAKMTAGVLFILAQALFIGMLANLAGIPQVIVDAIGAADLSAWEFLLIANLVLLVLGCFLDGITLLTVVTPLLLPSIRHLDIDLIHFGIILTLSIEIAAITPPIGINLFVISGVSKTPMEKVARGVLPFGVVMLLALIVIIYVPWLSLVLLRN